MIHFKNVDKSFGKLKVLKDISFVLEKGQSVALIGPNGSGKTTLIKTILGMNVPDSGTIDVNGFNTTKDYNYRSYIGYMPQIGNYPKNLKIQQLIDMMADIRGNTKPLDDDLIHSFKLKDMYDKALGTLSGGTRQKVSATLAFLFDPEILILDEPTAGLDPLSSEILKDKIRSESNKGKLIILTSHILADLEELSTHVMYLEEGNLKFFKKMEDVIAETGENKLSKAIAYLMANKTKVDLI